MKLVKNDLFKELAIGNDGVHIDLEIYRDDHDDEESRSLYISHNGSSGSEYHGLTTAEEIGQCIAEYIEYNM